MKTTELLTLIAASAAALILARSPALGQTQNCAPRDYVLDQLDATYGETRRSIALGSDEQVIEVFASDATGSWSITVTLPNGMMCLMASGMNYEPVAPLPDA